MWELAQNFIDPKCLTVYRCYLFSLPLGPSRSFLLDSIIKFSQNYLLHWGPGFKPCLGFEKNYRPASICFSLGQGSNLVRALRRITLQLLTSGSLLIKNVLFATDNRRQSGHEHVHRAQQRHLGPKIVNNELGRIADNALPVEQERLDDAGKANAAKHVDECERMTRLKWSFWCKFKISLF